jgi:hypothetical protein
MLAFFGAKGEAVLAGACVTLVVLVGNGVPVVEESHPPSATPTTAMMIGTAPRRMTSGAQLGLVRSERPAT